VSDTETTLVPLTDRVARTHPRVAWTDDTGTHQRAIEAPTLLGSAGDAQLTVADRGVSRVHAELDPRADGLWVRDLGSKNGTWVNGVRIGLARASEGAPVRVGKTDLVVSYAAPPSEVALWPSESFGPLVARSTAMRELFARLARFAASDGPVLVQGETGTGKELVARAVHEASPRARGPYVIVDCGALPEALLEGELFGWERGAFTGAVASRAGAFETAQGGTVFLDEIGEMPVHLQPKLLRVLESRQVRRLGASRWLDVDVRFVCATHRDLRLMVARGEFREDLYFRLSVLPVRVPPLRERREDIPVLVEHFTGGARLDPELVRDVLQRPWPGNVRELRNFVDRAAALGAREALAMMDPSAPAATAPAQPLGVDLDVPFKELRERFLDALEREYVSGMLAHCNGNVSLVAQKAGLDRSYVHRLLKHDLG
jgi:transcriptional regulator with GAF, ATPase, and Fis domain